MELEANKRYYKENKFDKWFWKDRNVELEKETNYPSDPNALSLQLYNPVGVALTTETETEAENPFNPVDSTLELIGAVGNVIADPISLFINTNDSSVAGDNLEAEKEAEREREGRGKRQRVGKTEGTI